MMIHKRWFKTWHGLVVAIVLVLLVFLIFSAAFKNQIDQTAGWVIHFAQENQVQGAIIFVLYSALSAMLAFASSAVLVPPATAVWGKLGAFLLLWGGWILGACAAFGIGRIATPLLIRVGYGKKMVKYQRFMSREIGFWRMLLFCIAVPSEVPGYVFGSAHYRFWKFITAMALAESLYAYGSVVVGEQLLTMKPSVVLIGLGIFIVGVVSVVMVIRKRKNLTLKKTP